jgi:hypothetical protein
MCEPAAAGALTVESQVGSYTDPLTLFRAVVAALRAADWQTAAALCDDVSVRVFARGHRERLAAPSEARTLTAEMLTQHSPDMPREVAEYQVAQHQRHTDTQHILAQEFPTVESTEALLALDPRQLFVAWLEGRSPTRQLRMHIEAGHISREHGEKLLDPAAGLLDALVPDYLALGVIDDGPDVAHVVYREQVDESAPWPPEAMEELAALPGDEQRLRRESWSRGHVRTARCRRQSDNTWRLHVDYDLLGFGAGGNFSIGIADQPSQASSEGEA